MLSKILIGSLSICLLVVMGFYLNSAVSKKTPVQASSVPVFSTNTIATDNTSDGPIDNVSPIKPVVQQPDKKLPVPAHQLKKVIASTRVNSEADLPAKIAAANQTISSMDQQISEQNLSSPSAQETAKPSEDQQNDINARLQHLKSHLAK
jgi:hypothetical protein